MAYVAENPSKDKVLLNTDANGNLKTASTSTQLPGTLGQKTSANSTSVVIASDQSPVGVKYALVFASAAVTRPADTNVYAVGDAITNSTSAPAIFEIDLASVGAVAGQGLEIRKIAVTSSAKQATLPLINVFLSNITFTPTNDNAALDIADAVMEAGGSWFNLDVQNSTASNSRVAQLNIMAPIKLAAAATKLYGTLQAANAYTPVSGEKFTIMIWAALL